MDGMISSAMLDGLRAQIIDMVSAAKYLVGETWYDAAIESEDRDDSAVYVSFYMERPNGSTEPATRFRLLNAAGDTLAESAGTVHFVEEEMLYRFKIRVTAED